ncbi:hypothetical protein FB45DRAFT_1023336 [Roridomyces roridus]|uniref:Uncharacterized protein n=1 Tax=Roridomyces roridus TaxID=1738132 RepID=A0AAD7C477_9AGAR|nr:hypothetical protein FB45DRAFT_1023336 [Roridomyces roridus]
MNAGDPFGYSLEVKLTDEEWDTYLSHKRRWCQLQPLVESYGYRMPKEYNPDRVSAWNERPKGYVEEPHYPHLVEGQRISDKRPVMLKFSRIDLWEATILNHLASIPDSDNHTIPLYDVITPPPSGDEPAQWCIVVTPRLTDCRNRHFDKLRDFLNFLRQVLEARRMFYAPIQRRSHLERTLSGIHDKIYPIPRIQKNGGLFEERGLVRGVCGQHRDIPELSEDNAYDPFPLDVRQIGEMLKRDYTELFHGLEFLEPWVARLRDDDPKKRPTAPEALEQFQDLISTIPEQKLKARLMGHGDWPYGYRMIWVGVLFWLFANGMLLWWNWDRFNVAVSAPHSPFD